MPTDDQIEVIVETGYAPVGARGSQEGFGGQERAGGLDAGNGFEVAELQFGLFGHEDDGGQLAKGLSQSGILGGVVTGSTEERVEHDEGAAILGETLEQFRMECAVPGPGAGLAVLIESVVIHQDEDDFVGEIAGGWEAEKIVITGVDPTFSEGHSPQGESAEHG